MQLIYNVMMAQNNNANNHLITDYRKSFGTCRLQNAMIGIIVNTNTRQTQHLFKITEIFLKVACNKTHFGALHGT